MSSKHTPGPWSCKQGERPNFFYVESQSGDVVYVSGAIQPARVEDNARLIAAAPELLEALSRITSYVVTEAVESCNGNKCRELWCAGCFGEETAEKTVSDAREALTSARAAIAKATGEN